MINYKIWKFFTDKPWDWIITTQDNKSISEAIEFWKKSIKNTNEQLLGIEEIK